MTIQELKPTGVWKNFYSLTQIPRPSGHTEAVAAFLVKFAEENGAKAFIDEAGNVIMKVPATVGYEDRPGVVLQAHMDMVPQKTKESTHDFEKDPIQPWIDGEWVKAKDTTLGADDGMGVAMAMAIVEDKSIEHGPLEVLITRDEETGMYGAFQLKAGELDGKLLLNLDSETEGEITIGCAGGCDINAEMEYKEVETPADMVAYKLEIKGLLGGHSGIEINEGRGNANKLMARVLFELVGKQGALLSSWHGGNMRNAIPRDGEVVLAISKDKEEVMKTIVAEYEATFNKEYCDIEKEKIELVLTACEVPATVIPEGIGVNIVNAVMAAQDGVMRYIPTVPSVVETSCNFSIINIADGHLSFALLARSSNDSMKAFYCNQLVACFSMAVMKVTLSGAYSGWQPNTKSPFVAMLAKTYKEMFNEEAKVLVIHAGLECGIIGVNYPEMDMASIGPTLCSPHTPNERCHIPSVEKSFKYVVEILKRV